MPGNQWDSATSDKFREIAFKTNDYELISGILDHDNTWPEFIENALPRIHTVIDEWREGSRFTSLVNDICAEGEFRPRAELESFLLIKQDLVRKNKLTENSIAISGRSLEELQNQRIEAEERMLDAEIKKLDIELGPELSKLCEEIVELETELFKQEWCVDMCNDENVPDKTKRFLSILIEDGMRNSKLW